MVLLLEVSDQGRTNRARGQEDEGRGCETIYRGIMGGGGEERREV